VAPGSRRLVPSLVVVVSTTGALSGGGGVGPTCSLHERDSHRTCERCGAFMCTECVGAQWPNWLCEKCRTVHDDAASRGRIRLLAALSWAVPAVLLATHVGLGLGKRGTVIHGLMFPGALFAFWCALQSRSLARKLNPPLGLAQSTIGLVLNSLLLTLYGLLFAIQLFIKP